MQKLSEGEASELVLDSYLMQIHNTTCSRCGSGERFGSLYEVWIHPTKTRLSGFRELRPTAVVRPDLDVAYVELPDHSVMVCSDCVHSYVPLTAAHALPPVSMQAWAETLKRKYAPPPKPAPTPAKRESAAAAADIPAPRPEDL